MHSIKTGRLSLLLITMAIFAGCASMRPADPAPIADASASEQGAAAEGYKLIDYFYSPSFEIPVSWSIAYRGDVLPLSLPPDSQTWGDVESISFSIAEKLVSYGDMNWTQADVFFTEPGIIPTLIARIKNDERQSSDIDHWETKKIGGEDVEVAVFKKNPDGSVDKGATGGAIYYFPDKNVIIQKQSFGGPSFEAGFAHFLESIRFRE